MKNIKKLIVEAIQKGLQDSRIEREQMRLEYNNHPWVMNYNYAFSGLHKLKNQNGLHVEKIRRHSYEMAVVYDENEKTLYTICSDNKFYSLLKRKSIDKFHFTDAFCLSSSHEGNGVQTNMFGEEVEINTHENLISLLQSLMAQFSNVYDIKEYCILVCKFNHKSGELYRITGKYMCKNYQVYKTDESWNEFILPDVEILDESEDELVEKRPTYEIKIKSDVKFKQNEDISKDQEKNS